VHPVRCGPVCARAKDNYRPEKHNLGVAALALLAIAMASNVGSTATITGNP
jgi:Na+/H+ antiporter NhaD/arsenite permease-like protein